MGKPRIDIPLKEEPEKADAAAQAGSPAAPGLAAPVTTRCTVTENDISRVFFVTIEPITSPESGQAFPPTGPESLKAPEEPGTFVYSTFAGSVEVSDIKVELDEMVKEGQVVAEVEAMKAHHDIKAPCAGRVSAIHVHIGDEVDSHQPILTIS